MWPSSTSTRAGGLYRHCANRCRGSRSGFTLIDMIIVVGIIGILLAIASPHMKRFRIVAEETTRMTAMRQSLASIHAYSEDHRMHFPFVYEPENPDGPWTVNGVEISGGATNLHYFIGQSRLWPTIVEPYFSGWPTTPEPDGYMQWFDERALTHTTFLMTCCAFARPAYWVDDHGWDDVKHFRGTRLSDVRLPASKGLLLDVGAGVWHPTNANRYTHDGGSEVGLRNDIFVGFVDGSTSVKHWEPKAPSVARPFASHFPIMSTLRGMAGADF